MLKYIKNLFKPQPLVIERVKKQEAIDHMVGEPVLSFVKCLKNHPKRFKLRVHTRQHVESTNLWPLRYPWMNDGGITGFWSFEDREDGSIYYAIVHKGEIYNIEGLGFTLNGWEKKYLSTAFFQFRGPARVRKNEIQERKWEEERRKHVIRESLERMRMKEKFQ